MTSPWEEITGFCRPETAAEALARWNAGRADAPMTEQQIAEKLVADRERMRRHDARFSGGFLTGSEERLVSIELARQLGHMPTQERYDDGDDFDMGQGD